MGISTHVLETSIGLPAVGIGVRLERLDCDLWQLVGRATTDADGRCKDLLPEEFETQRGRYRLRLETGEYYAARDVPCLYPYVEIAFEVRDDQHHHIPLLLTANGYTTYRGS